MEKLIKAVGTAVIGMALVFFIAVIMAFPVKWSWNYVMPYLFGFKTVGFLQAWCLMFLAATFFKCTPSVNVKD